MSKVKFFISLILMGILVFAQVSPAFAAPELNANKAIAGVIQIITLESDPTTGITTVLVTVTDKKGDLHTVRVGLETATELGIVTLDGDGNPLINQLALGQSIEIDPTVIISDEEKNPVGSALSTFFSDVEGLDYSVIMEAHGMGNGFGVIAQVLWLTRKLGGDASDFLALLDAKKNNNFSDYVLEDGTNPTSWGQLKQAIMDGGKNGNLGVVMSNKGNDNGNGGTPNTNSGNENKNKDKSNNGNGKGNNNGNGGNNGKGNGNGNKP